MPKVPIMTIQVTFVADIALIRKTSCLREELRIPSEKPERTRVGNPTAGELLGNFAQIKGIDFNFTKVLGYILCFQVSV